MLLLSYLFIAIACDKEEELVDIRVTPEETILLKPNATLQFQANQKLTWQATGGIINSNGLFTAPNSAGIFEVIAFNKQDTAVRTVIVTPHAELFKAMQKGGYVLYFRHMNAATGSDNLNNTTPNWWKSCDATVARQLTSPDGYTQADQTGKAIKNVALPIGKVISSEFCRCVKSAETLNLTLPIEISPAITYWVYGDNERYQKTLVLINAQTKNDKNIILMGHSFTSSEPGIPNLQMGDAAIYKLSSGNQAEFVTIIKTTDWTILK